MLIKISIDVWRDVFDSFSLRDRKRLALKFNEVKDREFSDICQKWLHEWIKDVCLEGLVIDTDGDDGKSARLRSQASGTVQFAEVEMPANINDFERIRISYFDTSALNFLRQLQPLFRGVNLHVYFYEKSVEATRTALTHLMPLFSGGIEFLILNSDSNQLLPTIRDNFQAQFLGIKILVNDEADIDDFFELYLPWLSTRRADGQPRTLSMRYDNNTSVVEIIDRIRQNFLDTTSGPVSFFISFSTLLFTSNILESIIIQNAITNEQLVIRKTEFAWMHNLLIGRCPAEEDGQTWIEEMDRKLEETNQIQKRTISITYPTIGQIEEAQQQMDGNEIEENGDDADQQPGPSNRI